VPSGGPLSAPDPCEHGKYRTALRCRGNILAPDSSPGFFSDGSAAQKGGFGLLGGSGYPSSCKLRGILGGDGRERETDRLQSPCSRVLHRSRGRTRRLPPFWSRDFGASLPHRTRLSLLCCPNLGESEKLESLHHRRDRYLSLPPSDGQILVNFDGLILCGKDRSLPAADPHFTARFLPGL